MLNVEKPKDIELDFETRAMIAASGQVLTKRLPHDFNERNSDEMDEFVVEHAWEPYEYWDSKQLWSQINDVATALRDFHKAEVSLSEE